jgi:phosphatidylglycerophosphatase A
MNPTTDARQPKPRLALAIATALGTGYLPKAPGTFGSLVGAFIAWLAWAGISLHDYRQGGWDPRAVTVITLNVSSITFIQIAGGLAVLVSAIGAWAADRVALHLQKSDPQIVVIDEVAGQMISYFGLATTATLSLNWKYLLAGFILFRVFDIWKPFPARLAESLPGGLGIMADDWVAGVYAALVLALVRRLGL